MKAGRSLRWERFRWPVVVAAVIVLTALVGALGLPRGNGQPLDPRNAGPGGSRALAQVLRAHGIDVLRVTRTAPAVDAASPGSTLLVTSPELLGDAQLRRIRDSGADLVLVEPQLVALRGLAAPVLPAGTRPAAVTGPACTDPAALAAGSALAGGHLYRITGPGPGSSLCYPGAGRPGTGSLTVSIGSGRRVTVIGQAELLTNDRLAQDGNAALALTLLGVRSRLVWYLPDPLELSSAADAPTLRDLIPRWVPWVVAELVLTLLVTMLWRGRRLGRLVPEPLPVVVRAAETQEGRARLYRQSSARGRAAATLRTAALRRISRRLATPAGSTPEQLVGMVADLIGRPAGQLHDTLLGGAPADDAAMVRLADDLDELSAAVALLSAPGSSTAG